MSESEHVTRAQFIELTQIVRTTVILDFMYEWLRDLAPEGHPLWDLWGAVSTRNEQAVDKLRGAIANDEVPQGSNAWPPLNGSTDANLS